MSRQDVRYIADLLIKRRRNDISEEENNELQAWINQNQELYEELTSDQVFEELGQDYLSSQKILTTVTNRIVLNDLLRQPEETISQTPVRKMHLARWWPAAAVIILLFIAGYFVSVSTKNAKPTRDIVSKENTKNDIQPGSNRAVLTLSGGSTIILDSVHNGILSKQVGANIEKKSDGKIAYTALHTESAQVQYNTLTIPRGGQYFVELSDGSKVWLNAASSLRYPVIFNGRQREVELTGEAYFEVAKKSNMPFHVHINDMDVEVLGTHFNINGYEDESAIQTTLLEGAVKVSKANEAELLAPGEQAQVNKNGSIKVVKSVDTDKVVAWKNGLFQFKSEDIPSIMRQVARWYDVEVSYEDNLPARKFTGEIPRNVNASELLNMLEYIGIRFTIEGKKIKVMH